MSEDIRHTLTELCSRIERHRRSYERASLAATGVRTSMTVSREQMIDGVRDYGLELPEGLSVNAFTLEPSPTYMRAATESMDRAMERIGAEILSGSLELMQTVLRALQANAGDLLADDYTPGYEALTRHLKRMVNEPLPKGEDGEAWVTSGLAVQYTNLACMLVYSDRLRQLLPRLDVATLTRIEVLEELMGVLTRMFEGDQTARAAIDEKWAEWVGSSELQFLQKAVQEATIVSMPTTPTSTQELHKLVLEALTARAGETADQRPTVINLADQVAASPMLFGVAFPMGQYGIVSQRTRYQRLTDAVEITQAKLRDHPAFPADWTGSCVLELSASIAGQALAFYTYYQILELVHRTKVGLIGSLVQALEQYWPLPDLPAPPRPSAESMMDRARQHLQRARTTPLY